MAKNLFASTPVEETAVSQKGKASIGGATVLDYSISPAKLPDHILAFAVGFLAGFAVLFIFYQLWPLGVVGGVVVGTVNIFKAAQGATKKRMLRLRTQFFDLLEAMSVAMRAGNPMLKALTSARDDLAMIYPEGSDILVELDLIISRFHNAVPLSEAFADFAARSGLEDVESFASIYATIEGKSSRADEIIRETQQIIADKMTIEMEIETMMSAAKSEVNIMLFMPLVILLVIAYAGGGFMDALYTTAMGRVVATGGLIVFGISYVLAQKFSDVKL